MMVKKRLDAAKDRQTDVALLFTSLERGLEPN
jgi:hypothetical protein